MQVLDPERLQSLRKRKRAREGNSDDGGLTQLERAREMREEILIGQRRVIQGRACSINNKYDDNFN